MNSNLQTAIYNKAITVPGLYGYINDNDKGNVFYKNIPKGSNAKCVFQELTNPADLRDNKNIRTEYSIVEFSFYDDDQNALETLITNFRSVFDDCESSLSVPGYQVISVRWQLTRDSSFEETNKMIIQYKIRLNKIGV